MMTPRPETHEQALDRIDAWHEAETDQPLHDWIGWTWDEYAAWVETGKVPTP